MEIVVRINWSSEFILLLSGASELEPQSVWFHLINTSSWRHRHCKHSLMQLVAEVSLSLLIQILYSVTALGLARSLNPKYIYNLGFYEVFFSSPGILLGEASFLFCVI